MLKGIVREPLRFILRGIFLPFLGWLFIVPIACLIPKKQNLMILWGRDGGNFVDNIKYFYLHLKSLPPEGNLKFYLLTDQPKIYKEMVSNGLEVLFFPKIKTILKILRSNVLVIDSVDWINGYKYHLFYGARKIQIWHGFGLKKIGNNSPHLIRARKHWIMRLYHFLKGSLPRYDVVVSTSDICTEKGYINGLNYNQVIKTGYPRNDILINKIKDYHILAIDLICLREIEKLQKQHYKIVLYCPTFRDTGGDALSEGVINIKTLSQFGLKNKIAFVFKLHSWGKLKNQQLEEYYKSFPNLLCYKNNKDVYPLMTKFDLMISDYSSIYLDFLFVNKPIILFPYDFEKYLKKDRDFYFDYEFLNPGVTCLNQKELESRLTDILINKNDNKEGRRKEMLEMAFSQRKGRAAQEIWETIQNCFLNPGN